MEPIYSFDRPRHHTKALADLLPDLGVVEGQNTFPLPCYAGDIHKRVEHVHGTLVKQMDKVLRHVRTNQSHTFYRHQLRHLAMRVSGSSVAP